MTARGGISRPGAWLALLLAVALVLGGCATQTRSVTESPPPGLPHRVELSDTPFYPQERFQCGPAALAMTLGASGISVGPEALVPQVYLPQREGSLQPEMLAAGRRNGAVTVGIPPRLDAMLVELAAGHPVVVLQNLSLPWFPLWHYAVAIGYDLDREEVMLRSGTTARLSMSMSTFEHTWKRSGQWGMVVLPPGDLPATADEDTVVAALVAFERTNPPAKARKAYGAALRRWPGNLTLQLGRGNSAYAEGDREAAAAAFREATERHPQSVAALNNLASVLAELGELAEARRVAEKAITLGGPWTNVVQQTMESINTSTQEAGR